MGLLEVPAVVDPSQKAVNVLALRVELLNSALQDIHARMGSAEAHCSSPDAVWEAPSSELQTEWSTRRSLTQSVVRDLSSKFVQTNLKYDVFHCFLDYQSI